jgi:pimeloyl-ACP methyl ester carboxylesterase
VPSSEDLSHPEDRPFPEPDRATFFEVNRTRIRAWCWGDPTDPPVLLTHGAHDHGRMWDDFAPRLAGLGFHVVAIDARGHGDSGRLSSGMMWTAATIDLCELARVLSRAGEPIGMIGHSMGGGQVLSAAGTAPERVALVVNLDGLGPPADAFADDDLADMARRSVDSIIRARTRPPKVWPSRAEMAARRGAINVRLPRRFLDHLVDHGTVETEGGFLWKTDPLFSLGVPDGFSIDMILESFADVTAPVLALMSSEEDAWTDVDDAEVERRIARFPDARWRSVPGAGHYVHVERPELVLAEIESFLRDLGVLDGA